MQASAIVYNALVIAETRLGLGLPSTLFPKVNVERHVLVCEFINRIGSSSQSLTSAA
jgi:hypothetical protein